MDTKDETRKYSRRATGRRVKAKYGDYGKIFECDKCGITFSTGAGLDIHMRCHEQNTIEMSSLKRKETVQENESNNDAEEDQPSDELLNVCDNVLDPDYVDNGRRRRTRSRNTREEQRQVCEVCNMSLANASSLKTHMRRHTGERPYVCTLCDKRFSQLNGLIVHMHTHSNERFPCPECGLVFTQLRSLKKHSKYHTGELALKRPIHGRLAEFKVRIPKDPYLEGVGGYETVYRCDFCDKDFKNGSQLVVHRRIHTDERPFECKICQRRFKQKVTLQDHEKTHLSDKPHKCEKCGTGFKQLRILRQHMRLPICEKKMKKNSRDLKRKLIVDEEEKAIKQTSIVDRYLDEFKDTVPKDSSLTESEVVNTMYCCNFCDKAFQHGSQLEIHLRIHTDKHPSESKICQDHEASHVSNDNPHETEKCGTTFMQLRTLQQQTSLPIYEMKKNEELGTARINENGAVEQLLPTETKSAADAAEQGMQEDIDLEKEEETVACFVCELCGKVFKAKKNLLQHMKTHTEERPFVCGVCFKEFKMKSTLVEHLNIHTEGKPHSCQTCGKSFKTRKCLQNHIGRNICSGVRPFACGNCGKAFMYERYLEKHNCGGNSPKIFECEECDRKFTRHNLFIEHKRTHTGERPLECEECGKKFAKRDLLRRHRLTHKEKKFVCEECGMGFVQKSTLQTHTAVHSKDRKYVCKVCSRAFKVASSLRNHLKAVHCEKTQVKETKPSFYLCSQCGKPFKHLRWMLKHFCEASGIKRFSCSTCGKQFKKKQQLEVHSRVHTGARPFACEQCEKTFTQSSSLKDHMVTHTREKNHKCNFCDSVFTRKNSLQRHKLIIHQGVEPFICNKCGLTFKYKKSYDAHIKVCEERLEQDNSVQTETEIAERALTMDDDKAMTAPDLEQQVLDNILGNIERAMNGAGIEIRSDVQYQIIVGENANEVTVQVSGDTR